MNMPDLDDLLYAIHLTAKQSKPGISGVARAIGASPVQLAQKLNPSIATSLPNIAEFIAVLSVTEDVTPLDVLCEMFDGQFVTRSGDSEKSVELAMLKVEREVGALANSIIDAVADNEVDAAEKVEIRRRTHEIRTMLASVENSL